MTGPVKIRAPLDSFGCRDPDEMEVIKSTVAWPSKRLSAVEVLSLPYFKDVTVEPLATSLTIKPHFINGTIMRDFIKIITSSTQFEASSAKVAYYAVTLLSEYSILHPDDEEKKAKITAETVEAMVIISESFSNLITISKNEIPEPIKREISKILVAFDGKIAFPTCFDFMMEYVDSASPLYNQKTLDKVLLAVFYVYSTDHTADEVAQITLFATGLSADKGLKHGCKASPNIYTKEIYENLIVRRAVNGILDFTPE